MNPIEQAILQEEIRNAINALFVNGQVGRSNKVVLEWNDKKTYETMETTDERGTVAKVSNTAIDPATVKYVTLTARDANTGDILAEETAENFTTELCPAGGTLVISPTGVPVLWIVTAEDVGNVPNGDAIIGTWFCNASNSETSVTITMTAVTETIHPIDPKFLPGVCLPVVELTTEPTVGTSASLTADESAKLDEVVTLKTPIVLNFVYPDMGEMSCVCFYMASANGFVHHFSFGNAMTLIVGYGDGAWYTSLTEG